MMAGIKRFRDLEIWQRSMEIVADVYRLTANLPQTEIYGPTSQIRQASVSIPSNIAECHVRPTKDYMRFHSMVLGSAAELETQLEFALRAGYIDEEDFVILADELA